jgi:regulatory protein
MAWLARRDFCSQELAARLTERGHGEEAIGAALSELTARRFLDDARYAQRFVATHAARGHGPLRIRRELLALGVGEALAQAALQEYASECGGWAQLAASVRARRFGREPPAGFAELARQARFLQYRGFGNDEIRAALGEQASGDLPDSFEQA